MAQPNPEDDDDTDWDEVDREYEVLLQELYDGRLPTLAEFRRDVELMMRELRQRVSDN